MDSSDWDERYRQAELVWGAPPNETVVEYLTSLPRGRAVDLACGEGRNALWLATRGWVVTGIDFSSVALEKAQRISAGAPRAVRERLSWVCADLMTADLGSGLDLVVVAYVHLAAADRRTVLSRAVDALAPGGMVLVLGHHRRNIDEGVGGPQDSSILYTPGEIAEDLGERVTVAVSEDRLRHTDAGTAIDALVVGRRV